LTWTWRAFRGYGAARWIGSSYETAEYPRTNITKSMKEYFENKEEDFDMKPDMKNLYL
jgi:hypothetical protein